MVLVFLQAVLSYQIKNNIYNSEIQPSIFSHFWFIRFRALSILQRIIPSVNMLDACLSYPGRCSFLAVISILTPPPGQSKTPTQTSHPESSGSRIEAVIHRLRVFSLRNLDMCG